ncbi:MAG: hypothetical protein WEE64_03285 [Dehalococcoidia bacterium]
MPMKITARKESEVPQPAADGKVNEELEALRAAMAKLPPASVLEVEVPRGRTAQGVKAQITRAGKQIGSTWMHWDAGNKVYAKVVRRKRGRPPGSRRPRAA